MGLDKEHILHYSIILGILSAALFLILFFPQDLNTQFTIIVTSAFLYVCYGILHHELKHDLTVKIVLEYVLVAALSLALFALVRGGI